MGNNPKPLTDVNLTTEFGEFHEAVGQEEDRKDYTYVPGFSDQRKKRDLELGQLARNEIRSNEVSLLPVNCRWYRAVKGRNSDPDQMRIAAARNQGYRAVTEADIGQSWLTELPPGAIIAPDGTIKSAAGDTALMVATQEVAGRNAMRKKIRTEEMVDGIQYSGGGLADVAGKVKGTEPTITKEAGK